KLVVDETLSAQYTFNASGGDATDASLYAWGDKGGTAAVVSSGQVVTTPGQVPDYPLTAADIGKVKEVSVQAKNGLAVTGNTLTVASDAAAGQGNQSSGGNNGKVVGPALSGIAVNGRTFQPNSGFPTTGFLNATYTLTLSNANPNNYNWTSSASWVSVDINGNVTFIGEPGGQNTVTITATPKTGQGDVFSQTFTVNAWFFPLTRAIWSVANDECNNLGNGYALPTRAQVSNAAGSSGGTRKPQGGVWEEWGDMTTYGINTSISSHWSADAAGAGSHYDVRLINGGVQITTDDANRNIICRRGL
ncbi:hypothetical protein X965_10940, partial [Morganella sp. EGD-HP17]